LGVLLMTPSLLIFSQYPQIHNFNYTLKQIIEYISVLILLSSLCGKIFLFNDLSLKDVPNIPIFVIFILIVWLSLRFGHVGTSIAILIVSLFALWGTAHQLGPLTQQSLTIMMFNLWFFIVTISLVGFVITVVIFELTESENKAKKMAIVDELTQLYNRRHFNNIFPQVYDKSQGKLFAFLLIDIDIFKKYNDTYGHQEGDLVLIKLGQLLKQYFQKLGDFSFRLGGEEFAAFILVDSTQEALFLAENLKENIENLKIEHKNNPPFNLVTVSIGLKLSHLNFYENQEIIYQKADQALYQAKTKGRNCICIHKRLKMI
ncbi:MAG: diguanylate cyclase, partial [Dolichospermum sp.]|nr:diguanylate cyclase [Dolichospermum sp.]